VQRRPKIVSPFPSVLDRGGRSELQLNGRTIQDGHVLVVQVPHHGWVPGVVSRRDDGHLAWCSHSPLGGFYAIAPVTAVLACRWPA